MSIFANDTENSSKDESNSSSNSRAGFKRKPLRIYVISLFLTLLPVISYVKALYGAGASQWYSPIVWVDYAAKVSMSQWLLVALTIACGVAISFVRKFTLIFAVTGLLGIFGFHLFASNKIMLLSLAIPAVLLATSFRLPYFNSELRWWEQFPRFLLKQNYVRVMLGLQPKSLEVLNMSISGALIDTKYKSRIPDIGEKLVLDLSDDLKVGATIVRIDGCRFGVKFDSLTRAQKRELKTYIAKQKKSLNLAR